ncbi:hypothetical protein [Flammeovirga kamogawensis]|uniref:Uncharacterized protein n=1 Tax=Flammeovirga kamogawensis TaxID=373891 RepID=A0ABX8H4E4_9BACT|nr:hypothetical protein [Flammeovirga kamogawensis]MBB6461847.1 hypothetical protein [Flammeovirga kamogawensis]QWG10538.1 hypothetical protein KM029_26560 [Flammeovirga kamogawensis]TRX63647.1 hypothetical protein EO216_24835 [Flammeovirga kamogawensis]
MNKIDYYHCSSDFGDVDNSILLVKLDSIKRRIAFKNLVEDKENSTDINSAIRMLTDYLEKSNINIERLHLFDVDVNDYPFVIFEIQDLESYIFLHNWEKQNKLVIGELDERGKLIVPPKWSVNNLDCFFSVNLETKEIMRFQ